MSLIQTQRSSVDALDLLPGVDLVPIKPIPNVVTLQEDITTEKCRQVCVAACFSLVRFVTAALTNALLPSGSQEGAADVEGGRGPQ